MAENIERLLPAVLGDNISEVTRLVKLDAIDVNSKDSNKQSILHVCMILARCSLRMIEHLVSLGADINSRDRDQWTPLHRACGAEATTNLRMKTMGELFPTLSEICRIEILEWSETQTTTLKKKVSLSIGMTNMVSCLGLWCENLKLNLNYLVERKKIEIIECLLKLGADVNAKCNTYVSSMYQAVRTHNIRAVKVFAELGLAKTSRIVVRGNTSLLLAAQQGEKEVMRHLVRRGADIKASISNVHVLHAAIETGEVEIVKTLLEHGANKSAVKLDNINSVFHALSICNDFGMFTCLANLGADFNQPLTYSLPIHEAVMQDNIKILDCLVQHGADVQDCNGYIREKPPILIASLECDQQFEILEHIVLCGADLNKCYEWTWNSLLEAVRKGSQEIVKALASNGAGINQCVETLPTTIVHQLVKKSYTSNSAQVVNALKAILSLGGDPNVMIRHSPLLGEAVDRADLNMVKILASLGADVNDFTYLGITTLSMIAFFEADRIKTSGEIVKILLEAGAEPNISSDVITPLILAVRHQNKEIVETLVTLGAKLDIAGSFGIRPIHWISGTDRLDIAEYLLKCGSKVDLDAVFIKMNPLLYALYHCNTEMIKCLIHCGATHEMKESYNQFNAIRLAILDGQTDMLQYLIEAGADLNNDIQNGNFVYLSEEMQNTAVRCGITLTPSPRSNFIIKCITGGGGKQGIIEILLRHGANKSLKQGRITEGKVSDEKVTKEWQWTSLGIACYLGYLDVVRLLLIDGSDANECDQDGKLSLDSLPLACSVDYDTLHETRTAGRVTETASLDFIPWLPEKSIESLLCTPGLGDVLSIQYPNCREVFGHVTKGVNKMMKRYQSPLDVDEAPCGSSAEESRVGLPNEVDFLVEMHGRTRPRQMLLNSIDLDCPDVKNCGSSAEGCKVGLPDEMDFLVVMHELGRGRQLLLKSAGHDYVHNSDQRDDTLKGGSLTFHEEFFRRALKAKELMPPSTSKSSRIEPLPANFPWIIDADRKANQPLSLLWSDEQTQVLISIDLVPCIHVKNWPKGAITKTWLLGHEELLEHGYYLVPKPPNTNSDLAKEYSETELRTLWKISFAHLDTYHMQHLDKRVKDVYLLAKCLRNPDVCRIMVTDEGSLPRNTDKYITSYMLKMIFFKNVEEFLGSDLSLGEMVCRVYDEVEEGLSKGFIPLYYMPEVSAVAGQKLNLPKCATVAKIMKKFVHAYYERDRTADTEGKIQPRIKYPAVYQTIEICPLEVPQ